MRKDRSAKQEDVRDDGRTIAQMNVDGMPWYTKGGNDVPENKPNAYKMTKTETFAYIWAAVRAGLLIMLAFGVVFFLFLLFCDYVWFR